MFKDSKYSEVLKDKRLSLKDKSVYITLCEMESETYLTTKLLTDINTNSKGSVNGAIAVLQKFQYLTRQRSNSQGGQFKGFIYYVKLPNGDIKKIYKRPPEKGKKGYVYVIDAQNGMYKIGLSKIPKIRLDMLSVSLPFDLKLALLIDCQDMDKVENDLHEFYKDKRQKGEWFQLTEKDLIDIRNKYKDSLIEDNI